MSRLRITALPASSHRLVCRPCTRWRPIASLVAPLLLLVRPAAAVESRTDPESTDRELEAPFSSPCSSAYFTGGVGASTLGPALRGLATAALGPWFAGVAAGSTGELFPDEAPSLWLIDVGPVVGLHARSQYFAGAVGAGLSYVHATTRGRYLEDDDSWFGDAVYEKIETRSVGVPLMVHGMVHWGPVGLGALLFGNFNKPLSTIGAAASLNLGLM